MQGHSAHRLLRVLATVQQWLRSRGERGHGRQSSISSIQKTRRSDTHLGSRKNSIAIVRKKEWRLAIRDGVIYSSSQLLSTALWSTNQLQKEWTLPWKEVNAEPSVPWNRANFGHDGSTQVSPTTLHDTVLELRALTTMIDPATGWFKCHWLV